MTRTKKALFIIAFAFVGIFSAGVMLTSSVSAQGGGVGGGGGAGGCTSCGGASTNNGYGWYKYSSSPGSEAPVGIRRESTTWTQVQDKCRNTGNDSIIAFAILQNSGGPGNAVIYQYVTNDFNKYNDYKGDDGGNWVTHETARDYYNNIPAGDKAGFTWGTNVAWFCYNFANQWNINGQSYIQKNSLPRVQGQTNALPGERLNWYHDLRNIGPQTMDKQIYYNIDRQGFSNGWDAIHAPGGYASGNVNSLFVAVYASYGSPYTIYDVTQNDVGNNLCARISWNPASWNNGNWASSGFACAYIPYSYALVPEISNITDDDMVEGAAGAVPVQARVTNTGATKSHTNIQWQITQVRYAPGAAINNKGGGINSGAPCAYFSGNVQCSNIGSGTESGGYGYKATKPYSADGNVGDYTVGTRMCYALSVKRNSSSNTDWRHSQLKCLVVGKKPKVQVLGGDLIVGRGYNTAGTKITANVGTSSSRKDTTYYGSWSEYAIVPSGRVTGMASASGFAGGASTKSLCASLSLLSFNNASPTCNTTDIGQYSVTTASPYDGLKERFVTTSGAPTLTGNVNIASLTPATVYPGSGAINLSSSTPIPAGKWVVINAPNADVRITSNITYTTDTLTDASQIPQLVIIARNIVIDNDVTAVDSWLLAKGTGANGTITTCDDENPVVVEPVKLTSKVCDKPLTVNGPIVASHLLMYRTAGAGTGAASDDPAEIFNVRPDAYMWATYLSDLNPKSRTVKTSELPPRF